MITSSNPVRLSHFNIIPVQQPRKTIKEIGICVCYSLGLLHGHRAGWCSLLVRCSSSLKNLLMQPPESIETCAMINLKGNIFQVSLLSYGALVPTWTLLLNTPPGRSRRFVTLLLSWTSGNSSTKDVIFYRLKVMMNFGWGTSCLKDKFRLSYAILNVLNYIQLGKLPTPETRRIACRSGQVDISMQDVLCYQP